MARTKQTARCSTGTKGPRQSLATKAARRTNRQTFQKGSPQREESEEETEEVIDVNQFQVKFDDQLACQEKAVKQEINRCQQCSAAIHEKARKIARSQYEIEFSKSNDEIRGMFIEPSLVKEGFFVWICEFCGKHNLFANNIFITSSADCCFEIPTQVQMKQNKAAEETVSTIYFVIDVSGSMDCQVDNTRKSRIEVIQIAIIEEIKRLNALKTKAKIGIITFGSIITIYSSGTKKSQQHLTFTENQYSHLTFEQVLQAIEKEKINPFEITKDTKVLNSQIQEFSTFGGTSLGPALLFGISLASRCGQGSKVIICTDGMANQGIGSIEKGCEEFYKKAGEYAREKQVVVNILTIKGDSGCSISNLSKTCLLSNGIILRVDPSKIGTEFSKIVEDEIIGTQAVATIRLNQTFKFRNTDLSEIKENIGNFNSDTGLTYAFDVLLKEGAQNVNAQLFDLIHRPIQLEFDYKSMKNGKRYISIFTDWREVTSDKNRLLENFSFEVIKGNFCESQYSRIKNQQFKEALQAQKQIQKDIDSKFKDQITKEEKKEFQKIIVDLEKVIKSKQQKLLKGKGGLRSSSVSSSASNSVSRSRSRSRSTKNKSSVQFGRASTRIQTLKKDIMKSRTSIKPQPKVAKRQRQQKKQKQQIQVMLSDSEEEVLLNIRREK